LVASSIEVVGVGPPHNDEIYVHMLVSNGVMLTVNPLVCKVSCISSEFKQECIMM